MTNDLIVMTFSQKDIAQRAWQTLEILRDGVNVGREISCFVERDNQGQIIVHQWKLLSDSPHRNESKFLEAFIYTIFGESHARIQKLSDAGLDEVFLQDVVGALQPENSCLVVYIRHDRLVDTRRLLNALGLLRGKIYHVSFLDKVERAIMNLESNDTSDDKSLAKEYPNEK